MARPVANTVLPAGLVISMEFVAMLAGNRVDQVNVRGDTKDVPISRNWSAVYPVIPNAVNSGVLAVLMNGIGSLQVPAVAV